MLTVEYNGRKNCVEVYGDREGLKLLVKRLIALLQKDAGSYIARGQGEVVRRHRENRLVDYYTIFVCEGQKDAK